MKIKPIASSSAGNCYIIDSGGYQLIIDCGVSLGRIRSALNYDLSNVVGCLVSHEHRDHSKYLPALERETSIPIYCTESTRTDLNLKSAQVAEGKKLINFRGHFGCFPLELTHDVLCYGFLIYPGSEYPFKRKLFYATDTGSVNYTIPGLTHLMIEANYIFEKLVNSSIHKSAVKRISETHLDIDQVVEFVSRHPDLEEIHLLHLSDGHSDASLFKRMVQDVSGCIVKVAGK